MKKLITLVIIGLMAFGVLYAAGGVNVNLLPYEEISQQEEESLVFLREEEKLAHDVYIYLYNLWGVKIFKNISDSEQTHTDSVLELLKKYNIEDPVKENEIGVFQNEILQEAYNTLTEKGSLSVIEAFKVGAYIEELDIKDIRDLYEKVDNADIELVFSNLEKGSVNHINSFLNQLIKYGETYEPQILSVSELNAIKR
ncbi:MAG TPA: DUF2202 domain-containing protein [Tepiditoga sp.]|nr:DUF2202 domain-containing protein [Tepiditoga sp.]